MPLDTGEVFDAGMDAVDIAKEVAAIIKGLPPKTERTFAGTVKAFGVPEGTPVYKLAALADQVERDAKD